jgi:hypothetical protein
VDLDEIPVSLVKDLRYISRHFLFAFYVLEVKGQNDIGAARAYYQCDSLCQSEISKMQDGEVELIARLIPSHASTEVGSCSCSRRNGGYFPCSSGVSCRRHGWEETPSDVRCSHQRLCVCPGLLKRLLHPISSSAVY